MGETELVEALHSLDRPVDPSGEERERIWQAVSVEVAQDGSEVDADAVYLSHRAVGGTTIGKGVWRMAAVAVVVLVVGLGAVWLGGPDGRRVGGGAATDQTVSGAVELPDGHPAVELLARGADDVTTFSELARQKGLAFQCVSGGMAQVCLVYADGLVAVVPFAAGPGFTVTVGGSAVAEEVAVPLDEGALAVPGPGGRFTAVIRDATGDQVASTRGGLSEPQPPQGGDEVREPLISDAEGEASYAVGVTDTGVLCAQAGGANESLQSCGGKTLSAVAFQAGEHVVLAGYIPAPVGTLTAVLDDGQRFPLELTLVPGQDMFAFGLIACHHRVRRNRSTG
jgi:hypothetical protein